MFEVDTRVTVTGVGELVKVDGFERTTSTDNLELGVHIGVFNAI